MKFRILPDNIQTVTTIYNSKITSIDTHDINIDILRIDILDESIDEKMYRRTGICFGYSRNDRNRIIRITL